MVRVRPESSEDSGRMRALRTRSVRDENHWWFVEIVVVSVVVTCCVVDVSVDVVRKIRLRKS